MKTKHLALLFVVVFAGIYFFRKSQTPVAQAEITSETEEVSETLMEKESSEEPTTTTTLAEITQTAEVVNPAATLENVSAHQALVSTTTLKKNKKKPLAPEFFENGKKFYEELAKKNIIGRQEFRNMTPYAGPNTPEEKFFSGAFQSKIPGANQTLRLNMSYRKKTEALGEEVCLSLRDDDSGSLLILENVATLRVLRSDTPGYLVIMARGGVILQIVITEESGALSGYLKLPSIPQKYPLALAEKPSSQKGRRLTCKDFW